MCTCKSLVNQFSSAFHARSACFPSQKRSRIPDPCPLAKPAQRITDELPVDVALGKLDYVEIVGFSDHRSTAAVWYRLLNLGFRIPAGNERAAAGFFFGQRRDWRRAEPE